MKILTLVVLVLLSTQVHAAGLSQNEWYLYGNSITPEEPQLEELNGELVVTVNGVQVVPPLAAPARKAGPSSECKSTHALISDATTYAQSLVSEGMEPIKVRDQLLEFFRSSELVESAEPMSDTAVAVRWKGGGNYLAIVPGGDTPSWARQNPVDPAILEARVEEQYSMLHLAWEHRYLVIITGGGSNYYYPPGHPEISLDDVRAEIKRAKEMGSDSWEGEILSDDVAQELHHPGALVRIKGR